MWDLRRELLNAVSFGYRHAFLLSKVLFAKRICDLFAFAFEAVICFPPVVREKKVTK